MSFMVYACNLKETFVWQATMEEGSWSHEIEGPQRWTMLEIATNWRMNFVFHNKIHYQISNTNTKTNNQKDGLRYWTLCRFFCIGDCRPNICGKWLCLRRQQTSFTFRCLHNFCYCLKSTIIRINWLIVE
jgi:hypothetical protein